MERTKEELGIRSSGRKIREMGERFELREPAAAPYSGNFDRENGLLRPENKHF